jgi:hypothetical protein
MSAASALRVVPLPDPIRDLELALADANLRTALWARGALPLPAPWRWGPSARPERAVRDGLWVVLVAPPLTSPTDPWTWGAVQGRAGQVRVGGRDADPLVCFRAAEAWALRSSTP